MLYKRLMGHAPTLEDLAELHPEVKASLSKLLKYDAETIESLGMYFQV